MSWRDYYSLLEKYNGNLSKATRSELRVAAIRNPNQPYEARRIAQQEWQRNHPHSYEVKHFWHKRNGHAFTARCPSCKARNHLSCGYDITRAATGRVRLDGWTGRCCGVLFEVPKGEIEQALQKEKVAQ